MPKFTADAKVHFTVSMNSLFSYSPSHHTVIIIIIIVVNVIIYNDKARVITADVTVIKITIITNVITVNVAFIITAITSSSSSTSSSTLLQFKTTNCDERQTCQSVQPTSVDSAAAMSDDTLTRNVPHSTPCKCTTSLRDRQPPRPRNSDGIRHNITTRPTATAKQRWHQAETLSQSSCVYYNMDYANKLVRDDTRIYDLQF